MATFLPAFAGEEPKIRIIREDGSVTEYQIPAGTPAPQVPAPKVPATATENRSDAAIAEPAPAKVDRKAPPPAGGLRDVSVSPVTDLPENEKAEGGGKKKPATAMQKNSSAPAALVAEPAAEPVAGPPLPGRKPAVPYRFLSDIENAVPVAGADGFITRDSALRIALDAAPPARRFEVVPAFHKGVPAYRVTFITDEGARDIMVDARSGDILK